MTFNQDSRGAAAAFSAAGAHAPGDPEIKASLMLLLLLLLFAAAAAAAAAAAFSAVTSSQIWRTSGAGASKFKSSWPRNLNFTIVGIAPRSVATRWSVDFLDVVILQGGIVLELLALED
jgi:hypothetical protein